MKFILTLTVLTLSITSSAFTLVVNGLNTKNSQGIYRCLIFNNPEGFPSKSQNAIQSVNGSVVNNRGECVFNQLPAGQYAVSTFHDENSNAKLDTNFLGIPKERYGFSNNASKPFGPPDFEDAAFQVTQDQIIKIDLK